MKFKYLLRARFGKDIIAEFLPPSRPSRKVAILCGGMPSMPSARPVMDFWTKKGYWVFFPRYRGSWESSGRFLGISPDRDILELLDQLPKGFKSIWDGKNYKLKPAQVHIIASSFGGPAGILASRDSRVTKVVAFSPVIDWRARSKAEPLVWLYRFVQDAFGQAYRIKKSDWRKLTGGKFYNPAAVSADIDGAKLMIFHARDDESVPWRPASDFASRTGAQLVLSKRGGHLSLTTSMKPNFYRRMRKFLVK